MKMEQPVTMATAYSHENWTMATNQMMDANGTQVCHCFDKDRLNQVWAMQRPNLMEKSKSPIVITVLLTIYWVLGTLGNALVIYVFGKKIKNQTSARCFIVTLAILDFLICLLVIPGELFDMWLFPFEQDFVCKGFEWMRQSIIPITAFVLGAIAFDRYFLICMAPATIITKKIAKIITAVLVIVGAAMGAIPMLAVGVNVENSPGCQCYSGLCRTNHILIQPAVLKYYFIMLTAMYAIVTVTITILYTFVFLAVRRRSQRWGHNKRVTPRQAVSYHVSKCDNSTAMTNIRTKHRLSKPDTCDDLGNGVQSKLLPDENGRKEKMENGQKEHEGVLPEANGNVKNSPSSKIVVTVEMTEDQDGCDGDSIETKHSLAMSLGDGQLDPPSSAPLNTNPDVKEDEMTRGNSSHSLPARHRSSPEVKTAQILCLVTACFVLAYFPFFLIYFLNMSDSTMAGSGGNRASPLAQENVGLALLYILHYTNNVVNPFVYGFMNRHFKAEVKKMIDSCRRKPPSFA